MVKSLMERINILTPVIRKEMRRTMEMVLLAKIKWMRMKRELLMTWTELTSLPSKKLMHLQEKPIRHRLLLQLNFTQ